MKLKIQYREGKAKCEAGRIRREGNIPAVLYSRGESGMKLLVDGAEFATAVRITPKDHLSTVVFTLVDGEGKERKALVKEIQYHVTTYRILHLDLQELHDDVLVNVNVPIELKGTAECAGVKLGGFVRPVIRKLRVRCLPKDMPASFELDVKDMGLKQSKRLSDISIGSSVKPMVDVNEVAVVIAKR